jgi:predicted RNA-binding Zn ribbon-like protein
LIVNTADNPSQEPGERTPAPGRLATAQDFVNAHFHEEPQTRDRAPETMTAWFTQHGLLPKRQRLSGADREHALQFRRAVRHLVESNGHPGPPDRHDVAVLNRLASEAALRVEFGEDGGASLVPKSAGITRVLGDLLAIIFTAMQDGTWARLKVCHAEDCTWAYYDRSKNASGAWCSMSDCGNRAKARAYRARRKA